MEFYPNNVIDQTEAVEVDDYFFKEDGSSDLIVTSLSATGIITVLLNSAISAAFKNAQEFVAFLEKEKYVKYRSGRVYRKVGKTFPSTVISNVYEEICPCNNKPTPIMREAWTAKYLSENTVVAKSAFIISDFAKFVDSYPDRTPEQHASEFIELHPDFEKYRDILVDYASGRMSQSETYFLHPNDLLVDKNSNCWIISDSFSDSFIAECIDASYVRSNPRILKARFFLRDLSKFAESLKDTTPEKIVEAYVDKNIKAVPFKKEFVAFLKSFTGKESRVFNATSFLETFGRHLSSIPSKYGPFFEEKIIGIVFENNTDMEQMWNGLSAEKRESYLPILEEPFVKYKNMKWSELPNDIASDIKIMAMGESVEEEFCKVLESTDGFSAKIQRTSGEVSVMASTDLYKVGSKWYHKSFYGVE